MSADIERYIEKMIEADKFVFLASLHIQILHPMSSHLYMYAAGFWTLPLDVRNSVKNVHQELCS